LKKTSSNSLWNSSQNKDIIGLVKNVKVQSFTLQKVLADTAGEMKIAVTNTLFSWSWSQKFSLLMC